MQLVCAGKCKSRADKGVPSFHGAEGNKESSCCLPSPSPREGKGGKKTLKWRPRFITTSSKSKPAISETPSPQELAEPGQNQSNQEEPGASRFQGSWEAAHPHRRGSGTSSASTLLFLPPQSTAARGAGPCPPAHPHGAQPKGTWGSRGGEAPRGTTRTWLSCPHHLGHLQAMERAKQRCPRAGKADGEKGKGKGEKTKTKPKKDKIIMKIIIIIKLAPSGLSL